MKLFSILPFISLVTADTPADCENISDLWGSWTFNIGLQGDGQSVTNGANYVNLGPVTATHHYEFYPDNQVVNADTGNIGTVTTIWNQGFEFIVDNQKWWANYWYNSTSYDCTRTMVGFVSDSNMVHWGRIQGQKTVNLNGYDLDQEKDVKSIKIESTKLMNQNAHFRKNEKFISQVNQASQGMWTAKHYKQHEKYTLAEMNLRSGTSKAKKSYPTHVSIDEKVEKAMKIHKNIMQKSKNDRVYLPENLDWRNHDGQNFVSPVGDQQSCGSCYSFGSMGMMEGRVRVMTNNTEQPIFSEQEIITCGKDKTYNQGCNGGFAYLIAGKYMESFGVVDSTCVPYNYKNTTCPDTSNCKRWYANNYKFLGGYYGATTNDGGQAMMQALQNGPVAVGFDVQDDFGSYSGGVYTHTGTFLKDSFNPFVYVNHEVVCVGYGVCDGKNPECGSAKSGTPYWIVKNSWGTGWGLDGFFLILRGVDEVGIESDCVSADPIPQF